MGESDRIVELDEMREKILSCTKCGLSKTRTNAVPGQGDYRAEIMFVGEGPGASEDEKGIPFCGASGKFLDEMLASIGLDREKVFITNTVKCRPPGNRDPEDDEKRICRPYLDRQVELIGPKLIVCLGRHAAASLLPGQPSISTIHGKALRRPNGIVYLPLYHPAAALHNGGLRSTLINDFAKIPAVLIKTQGAKNRTQKEENHSEQIKLI